MIGMPFVAPLLQHKDRPRSTRCKKALLAHRESKDCVLRTPRSCSQVFTLVAELTLGVSKWLPRQYTWSSYTAVACAILVSSAAWHICGDASVHGGCWAEDMLGLARQATLMACGGGRSVPALDSVVGGSRVRAGQTPRDAWAWDTSWDTEVGGGGAATTGWRACADPKIGPGSPRVTPGHSGSLRVTSRETLVFSKKS